MSGVADSLLHSVRVAAAAAAAPQAGGKTPHRVLYVLDGVKGTLDPAFTAHTTHMKNKKIKNFVVASPPEALRGSPGGEALRPERWADLREGARRPRPTGARTPCPACVWGWRRAVACRGTRGSGREWGLVGAVAVAVGYNVAPWWGM